MLVITYLPFRLALALPSSELCVQRPLQTMVLATVWFGFIQWKQREGRGCFFSLLFSDFVSLVLSRPCGHSVPPWSPATAGGSPKPFQIQPDGLAKEEVMALPIIQPPPAPYWLPAVAHLWFAPPYPVFSNALMHGIHSKALKLSCIPPSLNCLGPY